MPFARPSLTALRNQAVQDITTSGVPGLTGLLRKAVLRVLAWCMAGLAYSVYGYADWIARMGVPFTAENEFLYAWAGLIGLYPKEATAASGQAAFTGTTGTVLPIDTPLTRQDGTPYITTADGTVDGTGTVQVPMVATLLGTIGNCDDGSPISIASPVAGINSGGLTVGATAGGADQETDAAFRTRMLAKYRDPPQGGSAADYVEWSLEVPGCTRVWVGQQPQGVGSLIVYPMFDDAEAAHGGFPQGSDGVATEETRGPSTATGDQLLVADHIWPMQPVTALVYVAAPVPYPINVTLANLDPATAAMQADIAAALVDAFLIIGEVGGQVWPSDLYQAVMTTPGVIHFTMTIPNAAIQAPAGSLPVMGALTLV